MATGNTSDYRKSGVYANLMKQVDDYGLAESFKSLGVIPYRDLMAIMWHSVAVINPSFSEGWSITVEEAKSMCKKVILSGIPMHREQNPERGVFVNPEKPDELADALEKALDETDIGEEMKYADQAKKNLPNRRDAFGLRYQEIVMMVLKSLQC